MEAKSRARRKTSIYGVAGKMIEGHVIEQNYIFNSLIVSFTAKRVDSPPPAWEKILLLHFASEFLPVFFKKII